MANINYNYDATYQVKFSAWSKNKKALEKQGVLHVKYVTDRQAALDPSEFRIKIDSATLDVK